MTITIVIINPRQKNVVEGNQVQVQTGVSTAQARTKSAKIPGLAAGWKVVSVKAGICSKETWFSYELERSPAKAGMWWKEIGFRCGLEGSSTKVGTGFSCMLEGQKLLRAERSGPAAG